MSRKKKKKRENIAKKSHKKEKKKHSKKKKKAGKSHLRDHHHAKEDMLDLNNKLYPISSYLSDRAEMLNQMFLSLDWKHVKSMLPSSLKNESITRVKELALKELLGMSNGRIISVLNGQQLESSSDSDVGNENVTLQCKPGRKSGSKYTVVNGNSMKEDSSESWLRGKKDSPQTDDLKLFVGVQESDNSSDMDTLEIGITPKEMGELLEDAPPVKENKSGVDEKKGKTLLEILELEMRARAIRALLKQHDDETSVNDQTGDVRKYNPSGDNPAVLGSSKQAVSSVGRQSQTPENCNSLKSIFQSSFDGKDVSKTITFADISRDCAQNSLPFELEVSKWIDKCKENEEVIEMHSSKEFAQNHLPSQEITSAPEQRTESSWAARWFHSKDVQKVVSTSRMCAKIRDRMKLVQKLKPSSRKKVLKPEIIGSVKEYKTLEKGTHSSENAS